MIAKDGLIVYYESDFGCMKLPIPVPIKFIEEHPDEWAKIENSLNEYMETMWVNGFDFGCYKEDSK